MGLKFIQMDLNGRYGWNFWVGQVPDGQSELIANFMF